MQNCIRAGALTIIWLSILVFLFFLVFLVFIFLTLVLRVTFSICSRLRRLPHLHIPLLHPLRLPYQLPSFMASTWKEQRHKRFECFARWKHHAWITICLHHPSNMQRMQQDSTFISGRLVHAKQKLCDFWLWKFLVMIFIELEECSPVLICHFRILCHMLQNDVSCSAIRTTQCELLSLWLLWPTWWSGLSILVKESIPSPWPCHGESQKVLGSSHKKSHGNASTQTNCPKINNANNSRATFRFLDAFIHIMHLQRGFYLEQLPMEIRNSSLEIVFAHWLNHWFVFFACLILNCS